MSSSACSAGDATEPRRRNYSPSPSQATCRCRGGLGLLLQDPARVGKPDPLLHDIAECQGFTGPPHVVTRGQLDRYIRAGELELWRGVPELRQAEEFRYGRCYLSQAGIWAAYGRGSFLHAACYGGHDGARLLRLSLHRRARVRTPVEFRNAYGRELAALRAAHAEARGRETRRQLRARAIAYSTGARWAAATGIDALLLNDSAIVVFNRTALRVQDSPVPSVELEGLDGRRALGRAEIAGKAAPFVYQLWDGGVMFQPRRLRTRNSGAVADGRGSHPTSIRSRSRVRTAQTGEHRFR